MSLEDATIQWVEQQTRECSMSFVVLGRFMRPLTARRPLVTTMII